MKTLLAGNGINIQFGGKAYTSQFIIERMKCRATIRKYDVLFENTVSSDELNGLFNGFVNLVNRILLGEYDDLNMDTDVVTALKDFKSRYTEVTYPHDIMLEDWFFVLKMYTLIYKEDAKVANDVEVGFKRLFLDAIYNDGNIQNLYQKMGKRYVDSLRNMMRFTLLIMIQILKMQHQNLFITFMEILQNFNLLKIQNIFSDIKKVRTANLLLYLHLNTHFVTLF